MKAPISDEKGRKGERSPYPVLSSGCKPQTSLRSLLVFNPSLPFHKIPHRFQTT